MVAETLKEINLKKSIYWRIATVVVVVVVVVVVAMFAGDEVMYPESTPKRVTPRGAPTLEISVVDVNPIIARQFKLSSVSGVLVNDAPQGSGSRLAGIKRGDVITGYNNTIVQSAAHLEHLMAHNHPGDTVTFDISRKGKIFSKSVRFPQSVNVMEMYNPTVRNLAGTILILLLTFTALFLNLMNRTVCVVLGAVLMIGWGSILGFYDETKAFHSIMMSPILIFVGISIFSILLDQLKFFDYTARKMIVKVDADTGKIVIALCLMTYLFSLFVNNLAAILVMIPITLSLARELKINPVPIAIAEIIASNIGGASTMIGDFPNMLISSSTGLSFVEFLIFMAPICFILLLAQFCYMRKFGFMKMEKRRSLAAQENFLKKMKGELAEMDLEWASVKRTLFILGAVIVGFIVLPVSGVRAATIALAGGFILLTIERKYAKDVLKKISFTDILFFIALFIIVGGALHSGLLEIFSNMISSLSMGQPWLYLILLMWIVAFVTMFLNAGPATVFFIPIVMSSHVATFSSISWWALSLGVLAGSCATITGASAGVVTQTLLEENHQEGKDGNSARLLTFSNYSEVGIPLALIFLVISSFYILALNGISTLQ